MPVTLDYMEYANDVAAQAAYVSSDKDPASWDLLDEDCADISDWIDMDTVNGVSEVSPAGQFRMDANTAAAGNWARRNRDIGSFPNIFTIEVKLYHDNIGTTANNDEFIMVVNKTGITAFFLFGSDGLFLFDGSSWNEIGTNLVQETTWQTWRFVFDMTTMESATVDVYLNGNLVAVGVDSSYAGAYDEGTIFFYQFGITTNNMLTHIDYVKAATGSHPRLQSYSESTIKQQGTYSLKGIAVITDSLNDTLTRTVDPTIDLSGLDNWIFYIYSNRTGSNIKIGIHDSGGITTETTPNITSAGAWQKVTVNISGVSNANKDAIDSIIITTVNADAENIFYIDHMYAESVITKNVNFFGASF